MEEECICACGEIIKLVWNEGDEEVRVECSKCGRHIIAKISGNRTQQIEFIPKELRG